MLVPFLTDQIAQQRKSLFLWAPVVMGVGIVTYFKGGLNVTWGVLGAFALLTIILLSKSVHSYSKTGQNRWLGCVLVSLTCALFLVGYVSAHYRTQSLNTPLLDKDIPPVTLEATIEKLVLLEGAKAKRVVLHDININGDDIDLSRVRLKTYHFKGNDWAIGDRIRVKAKLKPPSEPVMAGGFDFRFKAYYQGLSAVGYTMGDAELIAKTIANSNQMEIFRRIIGARVYDAMDAQYAGIAQALLTGERAGIIKDDTEALRTSGLAHLLAISGLHIGLVGGCVFFFVRLFFACIPRMALYHPIKKYAAACAIVVALSYMIIAGATVPTVRAFIMTSLVLLAVILDRSALNMRLVALAAIIVMITTPEAVMGPSFILSFSAVAGLISFYQGIGRQWLVNARSFQPLWRPTYYVAGVIATTIIATLATAPFSVMFFNRFAVYGVIANVAAMPIMAFIVMPFGLLATLFIPLGMDDYIWSMMEWGIEKIVMVAHTVSEYENADWYLPSFGVIDTILISFGFLWLLLWRGVLRWIGCVLLVIAFVIPHIQQGSLIMIDDKMKSILIVDKSEDKLFLIGKMNRYTKSNWLNSLGYSTDVDILKYNKGDKGDLSYGYCDDYQCLFNIEGVQVGIIMNPLATKSVCEANDVVITRIPMVNHYCDDAYVIDRFDVWRHGAATITFKNDRFNIQTVR